MKTPDIAPQRTIIMVPAHPEDAQSVYWRNFVWHIQQLVENGTIGNCRLMEAMPSVSPGDTKGPTAP